MIRIETELFISQPSEKLWQALIDFDKFPEWNPLIKKLEGDFDTSGPKQSDIVKITMNDPAKIYIEINSDAANNQSCGKPSCCSTGPEPGVTKPHIVKFNAEIIALTPDKYIAWRKKSFLPKLFNSVQYLRIEPAGQGSLLHHGGAFSGLIVNILGKKFFKNYSKNYNAMNVALAKYLG